MTTINWAGASGRTYEYYIYPMNTDFHAKPGNYCFAEEVSPGQWRPHYFGETVDLSSRFSGHHKIDKAKRMGATHIHAHVSGSEAERLAEERDLCAKWKPSCNG